MDVSEVGAQNMRVKWGGERVTRKAKNVHVNSQRLWQCAWSLHRSAGDEVLELRGEINTCS